MKLLSAVLLGAAMAVAAGAFTPASAQSTDRVIRAFGVGSGASSVAVLEGSDDTEVEGPQAIYSGPRGEIYLLDQANGRILQFDPTDLSREPQTLELPEGVRPTDLVVADDNIYVWDGEVRTLQVTGREDAPTRGLTVTRAPGPPSAATLSAFAQMGSQEPEAEDSDAEGITRSVGREKKRNRQILATKGHGEVTVEFTSANMATIRLTVQDRAKEKKPTSLNLQVRSRLGAVELLEIDSQGRFFVLGENVPTDYTDTPASFVARYSAAGALEGVYELPLTETVGLSRRFVTVSPDGDVYFMRTRKKQVDVLGVSFRPLKSRAMVDTAGRSNLTLKDFAGRRGANAAVRPKTRQQVIESAFAFANVKWRVNQSAYGRDPDTVCVGFNRVRRPGYLRGRLNQEVQGIPYCWGCMGSLAQIATALERGMLAGNVCTRSDPRRDVAGVDCSAFVSAVWGLSTHFTTIAIPAITQELSNPWDLQPGDALNKPGSHVQLFLRFTADRKVEVMEASPNACNGRVCRNVYPLAALLARGYKPVRYRGLARDTTPVASAKPAPAAPARTQRQRR